MKNRNIVFTTIPLVIACFGLLPTAHAVVPAPDGGYGPPAYGAGNTAEGQSALLSLTSGGFNTAVGWSSLRSNTTAMHNTAIGAGALHANTQAGNTATGSGALFKSTIGEANTANGLAALYQNTTGSDNTANGAFALLSNTTANGNTAVGQDALVNNTTGEFNTANGLSALQNNTTGGFNVALGEGAGNNVITANNVICIGANVLGADVSNSCFIGQIRGVTTVNNDAIPVLIDSAGQLGTMSSSRRFKKEIKPMDEASESILALKPVSFRYKVHKDTMPQFGLIAEDVAAVNPNLVIYDADGKPYTVRYDAVNAMLLNEFLKQHRRVDEQDHKLQEQVAIIAKQQKQIAALTSGLQKVSAQLELGKPAPQTVLNDQ